MENTQQFRQFSDELRLHTNSLANLSLKDSIWSNSYASKRSEERRNFDIRVGAELNSVNPSKFLNPSTTDFNGINDGWKFGSIGGGSSQNMNMNMNMNMVGLNGGFNNGSIGGGSSQNMNMNMNVVGLNGGFNKGIYSKPALNFNQSNFSYGNDRINNVAVITKGNRNLNGKVDDGGKGGKKNRNNNSNINNSSNTDNSNSKNSVEKRFKTLPPAESLPRNEIVGGYIFVCNNDTMQENLKRQLFGLPPRYRDSVRAITPGLPLFLYNYSTHQLHGIFEASSFGGTNIDPTAWEDKKNPGESRFPAQVRVMTRKVYEPLEEDSFRPILHHYDGPKFRLELNIPEALSLLDIFAENNQ